VINQRGLVLPSYLPILAGHERAIWPVARTEQIYESNDRLMVVGVFPPSGSSPKSDEARMLGAAGVVRSRNPRRTSTAAHLLTSAARRDQPSPLSVLDEPLQVIECLLADLLS
jgi:hypothetical protein